MVVITSWISKLVRLPIYINYDHFLSSKLKEYQLSLESDLTHIKIGIRTKIILNIQNSYTHNWSLLTFSLDYDLASHITYVVWVNFMHKWRDLQFKVDSERQIFEKLFHGNHFIYSPSFLPQICWEKVAEKIFFSYFLTWGLN